MLFTQRLCSRSVRLIKSPESTRFDVYQLLDHSWGIRFDHAGRRRYAFFGNDTFGSYPSSAAALRALKRLRPDADPDVIPMIYEDMDQTPN